MAKLNRCFIFRHVFYIIKVVLYFKKNCKKLDCPPRKKTSALGRKFFCRIGAYLDFFLPNFFWYLTSALSTAAFVKGSIIL